MYIEISLKYVASEIRHECNTYDIVQDGYIYIEIHKGVYGLKEAEMIAFKALVKNLGTFPVKFTSALWKRTSSNIMFILAVDGLV